ncbi:MAG: DUF4231 domain-containing protein [Chloroflexi bacterium]|nr:DUF4231 domain-containing protein [Chloroflexota bacterium]
MAEVEDRYILERVDNQFSYFDSNAMRNQRRYRTLKRTAMVCNIMTTLTIALAFTVPDAFRTWMSIVALLLSAVVLATYQWEESENYGAKWEKFRLVAEQLKSERELYLEKAGRYAVADDGERRRLFVETVESIIRGTDMSYFTLMVEPGRRIEKRLKGLDRD